jgi:hypothetical protein
LREAYTSRRLDGLRYINARLPFSADGAHEIRPEMTKLNLGYSAILRWYGRADSLALQKANPKTKIDDES